LVFTQRKCRIECRIKELFFLKPHSSPLSISYLCLLSSFLQNLLPIPCVCASYPYSYPPFLPFLTFNLEYQRTDLHNTPLQNRNTLTMLIIELESPVYVLSNVWSTLPSNNVYVAMSVTTTPLSTPKQIYPLDFMWMYLGNTTVEQSLISSSLTRPAAAVADAHILTGVAK
jgi:hypothetical protein